MTFPNVTVNKVPYVTVTINFMATLYTTSGKTDGRVDFKSTALYIEKIIIREQVKSKH